MNVTPLLVDYTFAIKLAKNPVFHDCMEHINTKLIWHHMKVDNVQVEHCHTMKQATDILAKVLQREKFRGMLGLTITPLISKIPN